NEFYLSQTSENGAGRAGHDGEADWPTRPGDGRSTRSSSEQVQRLAEIPGLGVDSAQQIIAEVGVTAATFPSERDLASWVGACPGDNETAGVSHGHRSPKGNRHMRRVLNQAANVAVKYKGSIFQILYRRALCPAPGTQSNDRG